MIAVYSSVLALLVAIVLVPLLAHYAGALGLLDRPGERKIHQQLIPRVGGIAIVPASLLAMVVWLPPIPEITGYITGALLIFLAGLVDDRVDLDYRIKFGLQILGAVVFIWLGEVRLTRMPFLEGAVLPGWLGVPLTVIVLVAVTNAINLSDGMDGLAGGTSLLAFGAFGYMAYAGGDRIVALMALCLMGGVLGFLRYNTHPARVFMGDSGSQFLGFSAAVLGILLIERSDPATSPLVPVLVLGLPILDTLQVMVHRIRHGRSPFLPDRRHLHHRLLAVGLWQRGAVLVIYLVQVGLVVLAWRLRHAPDLVLLAALVFCASAVLLGLGAWERYRAGGRQVPAMVWLRRLVDFLRENRILFEVARWGLLSTLSLWLVFAAAFAARVSVDLGWLALSLCVLLLSLPLVRVLIPALAVSRLVIYTTAVLTVYLVETEGLSLMLSLTWVHLYLGLILVFVALWLRFGGSRSFKLNTMDVLLVLLVAFVPNMPLVRDSGLAPLIMESLLLFYAVELVLNEPSGRWGLLRYATLAATAIVAARGLLFAVV